MTPKRFFYVLCGLLVIILVGGGEAYYQADRALRAGTATLSQQLASSELADTQLSNFQDLREQYQQLQPQIPAIYAALPTTKDQSTIALQLHNVAASCGMDLGSLAFNASTVPGRTSQTVADGTVLAIPITFQLTGTYSQLQQFLQKQELLNRYTSVTSLAISVGAGNSLSFNVTLNAFLKP